MGRGSRLIRAQWDAGLQSAGMVCGNVSASQPRGWVVRRFNAGPRPGSTPDLSTDEIPI